MENYREVLYPYAYNILGSSDEANDVIQEVVINYLSVKKDHIDNKKNYLIKSVINHSINVKNKNKKMVSRDVWLPEPIATENAETNINLDEIISYSMLVLLENLNTNERAVFILKEAFNYSHKDIASLLSFTIENSRKLLSRAKAKLSKSKEDLSPVNYSDMPFEYLEKYISVIRNNDIKELENLLSNEVTLSADGGEDIEVVREYTSGKSPVRNLLLYVFDKFLKNQTTKFAVVNHPPAILFYEDSKLMTCQVFDIDLENEIIRNIYSVIDPDKLKSINTHNF